MSGKLNVKLKNRNGEDEVEFKVVVYDKPSPPIGPLEVALSAFTHFFSMSRHFVLEIPPPDRSVY